MPKLTEDVKRFIVMELATLRSPSEVASRVKEEFGIVIDRAHIHTYNPTKVHGPKIAKRWHQLFDATKEEFLKTAGRIPVALKAYRLRELHDMYLRAKQAGNLVLAAELLQQAARECGDVFTNRREVTGRNGRPVEFRDVSDMTDEQISSRLIELLGDNDGT